MISKSTVDFPGTIELSFEKLVQELETEASMSKGVRKKYLEEILDRVGSQPELTQGIVPERVTDYKDEIDDLMTYLFPPALTKNEIKIASAPWMFDPFYTSGRLQTLIDNSIESFNHSFKKFDADQLYISACSAILGMYYGYNVIGARPFYLELRDEVTLVAKHYRMAFNVDFVTIKPSVKAVDITKDDYHQLIDNYHDIDLWKEKFPPGSWIFSGFNLVNMLDLSMDWNVKQIEEALLTGGPNVIQRLKHHMSDLLHVPDLEVSFVSLDGVSLLKTVDNAQGSIMLEHENAIQCDQLFCSNTMKGIMERHEPLGIPNIDRFAEQSDSRLAKNLKEKGLKSYFITPVLHQDELIGLLELGSKKKGALNTTSHILLKEILPELGAAGYRFRQERSNRIEAIIQEEFTSIHPSVKWRFVQEAESQIKAESNYERHQFNDPIFESVYPLYGQMDIRGSSVIRNNAVRQDLLTQLNMAREILGMVLAEEIVPNLKLTLCEIEDYITRIKSSVDSVIEQNVLRLLVEEVEPMLLQIQEKSARLKSKVGVYLDLVNNEYHQLYSEHKKFDDSVNKLNSFLAEYIDEKQTDAQEVHPHYFERFKTDGIEFNMFVGESITPNRKFNSNKLNNLRHWQFKSMIEMEWAYAQFKETLDAPLQIASHIIAYSDPLSIHFRMDEKRFDVAGSYNVRYELIKKRIDKACIKGSDERITQPGKMVVILSSSEVEKEYLEYIKEFQDRGYLEKQDPEKLEVEELKGVNGLKALRVGIKYPPLLRVSENTIDNIMCEA